MKFVSRSCLRLGLALLLLSSAAVARAAEKHSLWKVEGKTNSVYLLGSIHVLKEENYPLPQIIETAFSNSSHVIFETDISAAEDPAQALAMLSKARLPEGQTLENVLSPSTYKLLTNHLADTGFPLAMVETMTPAMAATTVEGLEILKLGFNPAFGLDMHFFRAAKKQKKAIASLESVDAQFELLNGLSKEEGEWFMKVTFRDLQNLKQEFDKMLTAWQSGDADALAKLLNESMEESPALFKRLVTDRNHNWMPKLEEYVSTGKNAIIIVGAGHLVGKEGVVELLKKKGLKVTQL